MKKYWRFLSLAAILVIVLVAAIGIGAASAQSVCSPATAISVPFAKDGPGTFCYQASSMCYAINSWNMTSLQINGNNYTNMWVSGPSIPALNGVFTITYNGGQFGHFEIAGPCSGGATNTPVAATLTRTRTPIGPTATGTGRSQTPATTLTRTFTPTGGVNSTATRTPTPSFTPTVVVPTITWTPTIVGAPTPVVGPDGTCSPVSGDIAPDPGGQTLEIAAHGTFCWRSTNLGSAINTFGTLQVLINGGNYTNIFATTASLPAKINGFWYVYFQSSAFDGHFMIFP